MIRDLSHKADSPPQDCEVYVDIEEGEDDWVRIPVTSCELWLDKDGPSNLQRNAKVKFPGEWGGHDVTQYINGLASRDQFDATSTVQTLETFSTYDQARIWFQDADTGNYQIAHYGYVGGVGPAAENGVMKLWVYDPADLMRRIRVSKSFGQPTIQQVIDFVLNDTEYGLTNRSVFDDIGIYIAGIQEVKQQKIAEEAREEEVFEEAADGFQFILESSLPIVGPFQLDTTELVADVYDWAKDNLIDPLLTGQKRFQLNRHNMVDLMNWFAAEIGGKWHFEPTPDGPVLFFDNTSSQGVETTAFGAQQREDGELTRRRFIERELVDDGVTLDDLTAGSSAISALGDISDFRDRGAFDLITTLDNQALYDIKPFNSLTLFGETHDPTEYRAGPGSAYGPGPPSAPIRSSRFPKVEVSYPPLIARSGGYRYEAPAVESDKISLKQATQEAIKEFRQYLEEETEGSIEIKGNPYITPYDYITSIPVCEGVFPNTSIPPMTYEVNRVKHTRSAEERYTTNLGVSLVLDETQIETEAEYVDA